MIQKWLGLLTTVLICVAFFSISYGVGKKNLDKNNNVIFSFVVYLCGLLYLTILSRTGVNEKFSLRIFRWEEYLVAFLCEMQKSIQAWKTMGYWPGIYYGDYYIAMINEGLANIVLFIPLGYFLRKLKVFNWSGLIRCIVLGVACSVIIELLQLLTFRGTFDLDDIINNTLGFIIGFGWQRQLEK